MNALQPDAPIARTGAVERESGATLLEIDALTVQFATARGTLHAVGGADLTLQAGECLGIVGESGSGKTQLLHAILGLSPPEARLTGSVRYRGQQLLGLPLRELNRIRGHRIAMIFQDPMTALNPCLRIGTQIGEVARLHLGVSRPEAEQRALTMLEEVRIGDPRRCLRQYPHELSGGMRQRVMIAMALIGEPDILLADEPTTALDVTIQAQILTLLRALQARNGTSILLVTHDLGVIAEIADRVAVMYAGRVVEQGLVDTLFTHPRHPYTEALQRCLPRVDQPQPARLPSISGRPPPLSALPPGCPFAPRCVYRMPLCEAQRPALTQVPLPAAPAPSIPGSAHRGPELDTPRARHLRACWYEGRLGQLHSGVAVTDAALRVHELRVSYRVRHRGRQVRLQAVDGVSFSLAKGETLGIVGESGSGKSTLARALLCLTPADSGTVEFAGQSLLKLHQRALRGLRPRLQMIFQDPFASLDPHLRIGAIVAEPLQVMQPHLDASARRERVLAMLRQCGLSADYLSRYPHECSGGEAQRVGIARALVLQPEVLVCDEPISSLDASIRSQIANLLKDLQEQMHLSLIFIAHDLAAVRFSCDRVLVLYLGRVMEIAARTALFDAPRHPYTKALIQAAPIPDPRRARAQHAPLEGEIPSPLSPPSGCVFHTRCPHAIERCAREIPLLRQVGASQVACHRAEELGEERPGPT